ncbi:MAG: hypothetical protein FWG97_05150 [Deltaproteobacteria bacterium]|nr:hypothetical protein [Deltaproteobacteria bacterium]
MKKLLPCAFFALFAFIVSGCVSSRLVVGPDGTAHHSIDCSGDGFTWNDCLERAGELCGGQGYTVVERTGENRPTLTVGRDILTAGIAAERTMLIKCGRQAPE